MSEMLPFIISLIPVVVAITTAIFQWLWNITMPQVFDLKEITFWQAFRLLLLAGFLLGTNGFFNFNIGV